MKHSLADLSWAEKYLWILPDSRVSEEGLRRTVEWYRTVELESRDLIVSG